MEWLQTSPCVKNRRLNAWHAKTLYNRLLPDSKTAVPSRCVFSRSAAMEESRSSRDKYLLPNKLGCRGSQWQPFSFWIIRCFLRIPNCVKMASWESWEEVLLRLEERKPRRKSTVGCFLTFPARRVRGYASGVFSQGYTSPKSNITPLHHRHVSMTYNIRHPRNLCWIKTPPQKEKNTTWSQNGHTTKQPLIYLEQLEQMCVDPRRDS